MGKREIEGGIGIERRNGKGWLMGKRIEEKKGVEKGKWEEGRRLERLEGKGYAERMIVERYGWKGAGKDIQEGKTDIGEGIKRKVEGRVWKRQEITEGKRE